MDDDGLKPQLVDPVQIGGKLFERSDLQTVVKEILKVLKRGFNKPRESKRRHAKFVCECVDLGYATISGYDYRLVKSLTQ